MLLIDVVNPFDFPEAPRLLRFARAAGQLIQAQRQVGPKRIDFQIE